MVLVTEDAEVRNDDRSQGRMKYGDIGSDVRGELEEVS